VAELLSTGPQTVLVIVYLDGDQPAERMIPFVSAYVDSVDLPGRRIVVDWQPDY
jgi:16S rRNA processing protein RimM